MPVRAGSSGRRVLTLLVERRCNSYCLFCGQREVDEALVASRRRLGLSVPETTFGHIRDRYTLESAIQALDEARAQGFTEVSFQGGEPTIWPDLASLVGHARALGFDHASVVTNGRRLADARFAAQLLEAGLDGITVSVLGPDAATHDRLAAAPGSFDQLVAGLRNVQAHAARSSRPVTISANVVTSGLSYASLAEEVALLADLGVSSLTVHLVRFSGMANDPAIRALLGFDARAIAGPLRAAAGVAARRGVGLHASDVPLCLHASPIRAEDVRALADRGSVEEHRFEAAGYAYRAGTSPDLRSPAGCARCLLAPHCPRLPGEYLRGDATTTIDPLTAASWRGSVDEALAAVDPRAPDAVGRVCALIETSRAIEALTGDVAVQATSAHVDRALTDLMPYVWRRRDATALAAAVAARIGLFPMREVHLEADAWLSFVSEAGLPSSGREGRSPIRIAFGDALSVRLSGAEAEDGVVAITGVAIEVTPTTDLAERILRRAAAALIGGPFVGARRARIGRRRIDVETDRGSWVVIAAQGDGAIVVTPAAR